jgi:predicted AlkP superfamily pyrophosphatase or phosphodiesterase
MRAIKLAVLLVFLLNVPVWGQSLVVMGWDGAGLTNVRPLMEQGRLPNLKSIIDSGGCGLMHIEPLGMTCTVPNWTNLWTGMTYDQTGVLENAIWEKVYYSDTLPNRLQEKGNKVGWLVAKAFLGNDPKVTPISGIANHADFYDLQFAREVGDSYIDTLTNEALTFLKTYSDNYILFFHVDPDIYGHRSGENSKRYLHEFERADAALGQILPYVKNIIVVSDHGFDEGTHDHTNAPDNFLVTNLPLKSFYCTGETTGTMRDLANTILDWFNLAIPKRCRGKSLLQ